MDTNDIKTLPDLVRFAAESYGSKTFLKEKTKDGIREKSFEVFYGDVGRVAAYLGKQANTAPVHAALLGTSSIAYLTALLGTACSGNVAVPIDPQLSAEDACDHLNRADATILFYDKKFQALAEGTKETCPQITACICLSDEVAGNLTEILAEYEPVALRSPDPNTCAAILFTSGTTGKSKGVMLSHGNLIDNALCCDGEADTSDVILSVLPIHHAYCLTCDYLLALRYGVTVCINDSMIRIQQNVKLFEPTKILVVPMIADIIYRKIHAAHKMKPLIPMRLVGESVFGKKLKVIFCGGAYLPPELTKAYKKMGIQLLQGYGMTEVSPRICSSSQASPTIGDEVGIIVKGCSVKVEDGEILVKSPSVMLGYYKNEAATKEMFTEDGWLKTGDLGYVKDNRLYLTGRKKNLIILSNGENVSPEELENKFAGLEWLQDVMVYSEDEQITAEIYPVPEYREKAEKLFRKKVDEINRSVSPAKRIVRLRLRDEPFEKTTSQKVKRNQTGEKGRLLTPS